MGFVIFEQRGTFIPSNYGLVTGDPIQVVVVGGGGGGDVVYANTTGSNGGASSFGSYFSAAGGTVGTARMPSSTKAWFTRNIIHTNGDSSRLQIFAGSFGDDGWLPTGVVPPDLNTLCAMLVGGDGSPSMPGTFYQNGRTITVGVIGTANGFNEYTARTDKRGGNSYVASSRGEFESGATNLWLSACGGLGYGAGGAGQPPCWARSSSSGSHIRAARGGAAGKVTMGSLILPSTANITVTVGNGGNGAYNTRGDNDNAYAGGGARGCVAVFW